VFRKEYVGGTSTQTIPQFSIIRIKDRKSHWPEAFLSTA
jgi:hypothetical protein